MQVVCGLPEPDTWKGRSKGVLAVLLRKSVAWTAAGHQGLGNLFGSLVHQPPRTRRKCEYWWCSADIVLDAEKYYAFPQYLCNHESFIVTLYYSGATCQGQSRNPILSERRLSGASGEQRWEDWQTQPLHCKCFNLEALIYISQLENERLACRGRGHDPDGGGWLCDQRRA